MDHSVFARRRQRLLGQLEDSVAVLAAAPEAIRNGDVQHSYRQDSDLFYLTGFPEPESVAVLNPASDTPFALFVRPRLREREIWDGRRFGVEGAREIFGADAAYSIDELPEKLAGLCGTALNLVSPLGRHRWLDEILIGLLEKTRRTRQKDGKGPVHVLDPGPLLHEMRLRKEPEEVAALEAAAAATAAGHLRAMERARPGLFEYELQAVLEEGFRAAGSARVGYQSIVASGENATILHYVTNDRRIGADELILIDAGAELDHYTADVTRTFPAGEDFTPAQRRVYDIVLAAQLAAIDEAHAGRPWSRVHDRARAILIEGLVTLGFLSGSVEENLATEHYKKFYMHGTSHWLGMDVHDVGGYKPKGEARPLEPGMVLTVEPGLYFHRDIEGVRPELLEEYGGIGVRIEDDVLVTAAGPRVLTAAIPKQVDDLLALRRRSEILARA